MGSCERKANVEKILVFDGNSILNRAFYGVRPLTAPDGLPTNAIFGFINILLKNIDAVAPTAVAVAFDLPAPTFRHQACETYKANRKGMPDALAVADVVLSRAGSNTLSELLALHKPMLLVPYPLGASRGDQIENAKSYARQGLARVLMQEDMTARTLTDALFKLLDERAELLAALEAYPVKDGTQAVLALIEDARKK